MGAPSQQQIDEAIRDGLARGASEDEIVDEVASLERMSDEELAGMGVGSVVAFPGAALPDSPTPGSPAPGSPAPCSQSPHSPAPDAPLADAPPPAPPPPEGPAFDPATFRRRQDGWTADRQRAFIAALSETGCVSEACAEVGLTPRSAYRLREHPAAEGFRAAWAHAEAMATSRLVAIAFDRAIHGSVERIYKDGALVAERRKPSDRLLMWLLAHHDPATYGWLSRPQREGVHASFYPLRYARANMGIALAQLADVPDADCPAESVGGSDFELAEPDGPAS